MSFWSITFVVLIIAVLFIIAAVYFARSDTKKKLILVEDHLYEIEMSYIDFIEKKLTVLAKHQDIDKSQVESLADSTLEVLKPKLDGLISLINSHKFYSDEILRYEALHFHNVVNQATEFIHQRYNNESRYLDQADSENLYETTKKAIISDLYQRIINYQYDNSESTTLDLPEMLPNDPEKLKDDRIL